MIVLPTQYGPGGFVEYLAGDPGRMLALPDEGDLSEVGALPSFRDSLMGDTRARGRPDGQPTRTEVA